MTTDETILKEMLGKFFIVMLFFLYKGIPELKMPKFNI